MTTTPSQPRVSEVAADLRRRIEAGEFTSTGGKLPSTRFLVDQYGISPQAIARVVGLLKSDGVVVSRQGAGVFVRHVNPLEWELHTFERGTRRDNVGAGLDDWQASVVQQGRTPEQRLISVTERPGEVPPRDVARWLRLGNELAVCRRRLRLVDGEPVQIANSWFPASIALDTPLTEPQDVTMAGGILSAIGHPQVRIRDEITPRMPTLAEIEQLDLPAGTPVAQHVRIGFGHDGVPVRAMVTIAPGDLNILVYEMEI